MKFLEDTNKESDLLTVSRFRVWWLTHMSSYRVSQIREEPRPSLFGRRGYRNIWLLERPQEHNNDLNLD